MYPTLLHIYGPLEINSYGLAIVIGILVFLYKTANHPKIQSIISKDVYITGIMQCTIIGILGGRLLHVMSEWNNYTNFLEMISIWNGGLSVLGGVITVPLYGLWYLKKNNISPFPLFDIIVIYEPLIHCIARIGCFLAGCCYGSPTQVPWGITYTNPDVVAPLNVTLHPAQLYSSCLFFVLFLGMRYIATKKYLQPGQLSLLYLMLLSVERLIIDFFRGDRIIDSSGSLFATHWLSLHQWIALLIFSIGALGFVIVSYNSKQLSHS